MKIKTDNFPTTNPNIVLLVDKDGTVLYSNEAGESLLNEWDVRAGKNRSKCGEKSIPDCVSSLTRAGMRKHLWIRYK